MCPQLRPQSLFRFYWGRTYPQARSVSDVRPRSRPQSRQRPWTKCAPNLFVASSRHHLEVLYVRESESGGALAAFETWASVEEIVAFVGLPEKTVRRALQQIDLRKEPRRDGGKRKVVYRI